MSLNFRLLSWAWKNLNIFVNLLSVSPYFLCSLFVAHFTTCAVLLFHSFQINASCLVKKWNNPPCILPCKTQLAFARNRWTNIPHGHLVPWWLNKKNFTGSFFTSVIFGQCFAKNIEELESVQSKRKHQRVDELAQQVKKG